MSESDDEKAPISPSRVIGNFLLDLLIATCIVVSVSAVVGLIWGMVRWLEVMPKISSIGTPGVGPTPEQIAELIGQPGTLATLMMTLLATSIAAVVLYFWRQPADRMERMVSARAARRPGTWLWAGMAGIGLFVFVTLAGLIAGMFGVVPTPSNQEPMLHAMSRYPVFMAVFTIALVPSYEELLFRRVFFGRFWKAGFPMLGMLLSGVAFAFVHEIPGFSANDGSAICLLWLIYGTMGIVFAWLYRRTGTLWAAIMAHAVNNAIALLLLVLQGLP